MTLLPKAAPRVNYLNNRDILKEIHLSKNNYCWFQDRAMDHQFDIILPSIDKINQRTIAEARRNRADRLKREGTIVDPKKIPKYRNCVPDHLLGSHTQSTQKNNQSRSKKAQVRRNFRS
jgi:hypothetical protein